MNWKRSIKIAGLWITLSNVPVKKRNSRKVGDRDNIDSTYRMKDIRREVKAAQPMPDVWRGVETDGVAPYLARCTLPRIMGRPP